jgi:DNA polymerase III delta prime subunit
MQNFITKYKPYFINDFYFDEETKSFIRTLIEIDSLNILCVGNSKSGKTSLLYAIIREYYGLSKTEAFPYHNILFINNLKEQGINYFRNEMKTFSQSRTAVHGKKKMIVVDDIDMINQQSQQVFCNYIDKYKNNIVFVSVCTNIHKMIESIQSRTHVIQMGKITKLNLMNLINHIVENEKIVIEESAKEYLLMISNYSIRHIINYLEKLHILGEPVSLEYCKECCSTISFHLFEDFIYALKINKLKEATDILFVIYDQGFSVIDILDYFFTFVKMTDIIGESEKYKIIPFLCKYITIFHNIHEDSIELSFFANSLMKEVFCKSKITIHESK